LYFFQALHIDGMSLGLGIRTDLYPIEIIAAFPVKEKMW